MSQSKRQELIDSLKEIRRDQRQTLKMLWVFRKRYSRDEIVLVISGIEYVLNEIEGALDELSKE